MKAKSNNLVLALILICSSAIAQPPERNFQDKREKIEAMKVGFLTQKLSLNKEEAQVFWPVYNEYQQEKESLRKEKHEQMKKYHGNAETLSDKELTEMVDNHIIYRQRELDVQKKYHVELKGVLPIRKVALLYKAEEEFKKHLLKEYQQRKNPPR